MGTSLLGPELCSLVWGWNPLLLKGTSVAEIPSQFVSDTWVWDQTIFVFAPPIILMGLLMYILSCRIFAQLDFRWF